MASDDDGIQIEKPEESYLAKQNRPSFWSNPNDCIVIRYD
jgi:hypothetical protein